MIITFGLFCVIWWFLEGFDFEVDHQVPRYIFDLLKFLLILGR